MVIALSLLEVTANPKASACLKLATHFAGDGPGSPKVIQAQGMAVHGELQQEGTSRWGIWNPVPHGFKFGRYLKKTITWMTHSCTILAWFFVMCWHRVYIVAWSTQFKVVVSKILERLPTSTGSPQAGCETCGIIGQWRSLIMPFAQSFEGICAGNSHRSDMIW